MPFLHCPHRELHPKTKNPQKNLYFEASPTQKWGVFEPSPPLFQALSVAGDTAEPHLYDGSQAGQGGRNLQPGRLQGRGVHSALVGAVVEVLEVRLWSQLIADVANNDADDSKSACRQHREVRSCVELCSLSWKAPGQVGLCTGSHPAHPHPHGVIGVTSCRQDQ